MTKQELEENLGTIAKSGSLKFKEENDKKEDINIIGQFGVGFYSCFMVSSKVKVISKSVDSNESYMWESEGIDGYTIEPCQKENRGTTIILKLKEDTEDEKYSRFLEEYVIQELIKKYRQLDPHGKDMVDTVLNKEYQRSTDTKETNKITQLPDRSYLDADAAHDRTDIPDSNRTAASIQAEDDIMDDPNF